jgi:hypothetical protein
MLKLYTLFTLVRKLTVTKETKWVQPSFLQLSIDTRLLRYEECVILKLKWKIQSSR